MSQKISQFPSFVIILLFSILFSFSHLDAQVSFDRNTLDSHFNTYFVIADDLDKDGHFDIIAGHSDLAWWENNGSGSFTKHSISDEVSALWSIYAVDLDRDGDKDLLIADSGNHDIVWYRNNSWSFERIVIEANYINAESVAGADLDNDGDIDITGLTYGNGAEPGIVSWWENTGGQNFTRRDLDTGFGNGHKLTVADIDQDGDVDIIACAASSSGVSWYENHGEGNFSKVVIYSGGILGISIADMDNNGTLDILACEHGSGRVNLLVNNGSGSFYNKVIVSSLSWPSFAAPGDIDADGLLDVIVVNRDSDDMVWLENLGGNDFSLHPLSEGIDGPFVCDAADFDHDGDADPVTGSKETFDLWWWRTNSQNPVESITVQYPNGGEFFTVGEIRDITWGWNGEFTDVKIELSTNNGSSWEDIVSSTENDGFYSWQLPAYNSSQCLVRISESENSSLSDVSNSVFTIFKPAPITVQTPNGGESWSSQSLRTIEWSTDHSFANVRIDFTMDGGSSWSTIVNYETNDGIYDWTTPDISSDNCIIKIMNAADYNTNDESDAKFSILDISGNMVIKINCDDVYDLYVNGNFIGTDDQWDVAQEYIVPIVTGENVLAVYGKNRSNATGLIAEVTVDGAIVLETDENWIYSNSLISGWTSIQFDDNNWSGITDLGTYGISPWNKNVIGFPENSSAHWIWGNEIENEQYFRGKFNAGGSPDPSFSISGQCLYFGNQNPIPSADVNLTGDLNSTSITSATGNFFFGSIPDQSSVSLGPSKSFKEDVGITSILSYDAALASRFSVGLENLSEFQQVAADVDRNSEITSYDAAAISRYAVALTPLEGSYVAEWEFRPESHSINSINADVTGLIFDGILLGDVKGGWQESGLGKKVSSAYIADNFLKTLVTSDDDSIKIVLDLPLEKNVISFDLRLLFESTLYKFSNYLISPSGSGLNVTLNSVTGDLKMGGYSVDFLQKDYKIQLYFVKQVSNPQSSITIEKFVINNELIISDYLISTNVDRKDQTAPSSFQIEQNYPNPFNSETVIKYSLPETGFVRIAVYDVHGRLIQILKDNSHQQGNYSVIWRGVDYQNRQVPTGLYFVRISFRDEPVQTIKIGFIK